MSKNNLTPSEVQRIFTRYHQKISERSAYRYLKLLRETPYIVDANLVNEIARIKSICKFATGKDAIDFYLMLRQRYAHMINESITGEEVIEAFRNEIGIDVPKSTVSTWFKPLGGFNRQRSYEVSSILGILVKAYILYRKISFVNTE